MPPAAALVIPQATSPGASLLIPLVLLAVFFLVLVRPQRAQQKRVKALQDSLEVGQEVVLSAGIFGTIRSLGDARVEIEIAPGTVITVARQVVVRQAEQLPEAAEEPTTDDPADAHGPDGTGPQEQGPHGTGPGENRGDDR